MKEMDEQTETDAIHDYHPNLPEGLQIIAPAPMPEPKPTTVDKVISITIEQNLPAVMIWLGSAIVAYFAIISIVTSKWNDLGKGIDNIESLGHPFQWSPVLFVFELFITLIAWGNLLSKSWGTKPPAKSKGARMGATEGAASKILKECATCGTQTAGDCSLCRDLSRTGERQ